MKITKLTICSLLLLASVAKAQTQSSTLDYNNTRVEILNGGDFFTDLVNSKYEVPKSTGGKSTIFKGSLWLGAEEEDGTVHLSAMTYRQRGQDFWPGPHSDNSAATRTKYDKIYEVSAAEISAHKINSTNPTAAILGWPGNGDTTVGEPFQLAPFVDVDNNGVYEPLLGDYPKIKGTGAVYCIYSDQGIHTESQGRALGVDIHQLFYQDVANGFEEVNLASFKIINRSDTAYEKFKFGIWVDFDLGNFADDYVGSDPSSNMIFAYNGDDNDEGVLGYGLTPPAQNMMFLNTELGAAVYYNNTMNPINGNPSTAQHFYNFLDAKWLTGTDIQFGGDGLTGTDGTKAKYMFPFDNDPDHPRQNWNEKEAGNSPADRRMVGVAKETSLAIGEVKCFDVAFVYGRASSGSAESSIVTMKDKAALVQTAYDANTYGWKSGDCSLGAQDEDEIASIFKPTLLPTFTIYPNPSTGIYQIKDLPKIKSMQITDTQGRVIKDLDPINTVIDIRDISNGVYFLKTDKGSKRLIKI